MYTERCKFLFDVLHVHVHVLKIESSISILRDQVKQRQEHQHYGHFFYPSGCVMCAV